MDKWICNNCEKDKSIICELIAVTGIVNAYPTHCPFSGHSEEVEWIIIRDTGCSDCDKLSDSELCLKHQREQAEADVLKAMNEVERIKQKMVKENIDNLT